MTLDEALALYDANPEDPRIDEAVEYCGQIPDNVRPLRLPGRATGARC